jgi:hypothetical protein
MVPALQYSELDIERAFGGQVMKLRTILTIGTVFMALFTIAVWKSPTQGGN